MGARWWLAGVILMTLVSGGCAARGARPMPFPTPGRDTSLSPAPSALSMGAEIVEAALALQGAAYASGGAGPDRFDCSGLVQFVYSRFHIPLPRTVAQQFTATEAIEPSRTAPGDLLFFRVSGNKPSHVAIALGDGRFVHAPSGRGVVRVESLSSPYWRDRFQGARRVADYDDR